MASKVGRLSETKTGQAWLAQFAPGDDTTAAAKLLDALLLLNETDIADAIRDSLDGLAEEWQGSGRSLALYAEREFDAGVAFQSEDVVDATGRVRRRAANYTGPVRPTRGRSRVGSEGNIAYLISQLVEKWPRLLKNHPGPRGIRAKTSPAGAIVIVTDLIGSGNRMNTMLDKFWRVPSVKSWVSGKWIKFIVVAAAGVPEGISKVQSHRLRPTVITEHIVPTIGTWRNQAVAAEWLKLIDRYGPGSGRGGVPRAGYAGSAALVALSSRIPNNTPALVHKSEGERWHALYPGPAPADLRPIFRMSDDQEQARASAEAIGVKIAGDLPAEDGKLVVVLSAPTPLLRRMNTLSIAAATTLSQSEVSRILDRAVADGLLTEQGRLTEAGQQLLRANLRDERRRPTIATRAEPYYPISLRIPRGTSSKTPILGDRPR